MAVLASYSQIVVHPSCPATTGGTQRNALASATSEIQRGVRTSQRLSPSRLRNDDGGLLPPLYCIPMAAFFDVAFAGSGIDQSHQTRLTLPGVLGKREDGCRSAAARTVCGASPDHNALALEDPDTARSARPFASTGLLSLQLCGACHPTARACRGRLQSLNTPLPGVPPRRSTISPVT